MRFFSILLLLLLQNSIFVCAQRGASESNGDRAPDTPENPSEVNPDEHSGSSGSSGSEGSGNTNPAKANVPGAIAEGTNPKPAVEEDNEADIEEIGEKLKDLIEEIVDAIKDAADGGSATSTSSSSDPRLPISASPCSYALEAYSTCSSANANFSALPKTQQAGCLCNVHEQYDFNGDMKSCYSYAQNRTQYQTYATAVASGTALCACDPNIIIPTDIYGNGNANPCKATTAPTPSPTPAPAAVTSPTPAPTGDGSQTFGISIATTLLGIATFVALL